MPQEKTPQKYGHLLNSIRGMKTSRCLHFSSCIWLIETEPLIMKVGLFSLLSMGSGSATNSRSHRAPLSDNPISNVPGSQTRRKLAGHNDICQPHLSQHIALFGKETPRGHHSNWCVFSAVRNPGSGLPKMYNASQPCFHQEKSCGRKKQGWSKTYDKHFPVFPPPLTMDAQRNPVFQ